MNVVFNCAILINGQWEKLMPFQTEIEEDEEPFELIKEMFERQGVEHYLISYERS